MNTKSIEMRMEAVMQQVVVMKKDNGSLTLPRVQQDSDKRDGRVCELTEYALRLHLVRQGSTDRHLH